MNKYTKFILSGLLFAIASLVVIPNAAADIIMPGEKTINLSYEISNINDYDEYIFCIYESLIGDPQVITSGESFSFYKIGTTHVYAFPQMDYNESVLLQANHSTFTSFLLGDPSVQRSNIELLGSYGTIQENDPLQSMHIILNIISLNDTFFKLKKTKVIYTYTDGATEEQPFSSQDALPPRSRTTVIPYWLESLWYIWLPIIALICILVILLIKRKRNVKQ